MDLQQELHHRTDQFNDYWMKYLPQDAPKTLFDATRHLPLGGGKRLRPFLVMLACESVGSASEHTLPFGAALELMHNFTLVHDDIMDKSQLRRNLPSVHMKYGEPTAILAGDFLFARSFQAMHDVPIDCSRFKQLESELIQCIMNICEGQQLDIEFEQRKLITEGEYIDMIKRKTAVLFRLAARGGAIIGKGSGTEIEALTRYGLDLGLSFQIWDDYLDLSSDEETLGKDIGNDIRNGKKTLIAVNALHNASGFQKTILDKVFGNHTASEDEVKHVFSVFKDIGSIDYAKQTAISYNANAIRALSILQETPAKHLLIDLAKYAIQRDK